MVARALLIARKAGDSERYMTDKYGKVIYYCQWCGQNLHDITDQHSMTARGIYNDYDNRQYCSLYCARRGYAFYNELPQPETIPQELMK